MYLPDRTSQGSCRLVNYIIFTAPPVIGNNSPSFLLGKRGQNIELWCSATGSPEPQLTWLKDGSEVLSNKDIMVDGNKVKKMFICII